MLKAGTISAILSCLAGFDVGFPQVRAGDLSLPGPGLDIPVDVSGDGASTYGDRWAFNHWLQLGGSLTTAMTYAQISDKIIDLSGFFLSGSARLSPSAPDPTFAKPEKRKKGESHHSHIDFTRRIPQIPIPDNLSKQGRITPDGRFVAMSSLANLDGSGANTVCQIFRVLINANDSVTITLASRTTGGAKATQHCFHPSVSDDGLVIVFDTTAQLDPVLDQNSWADVYIRDFRGGTPVTKLLSKSVSTGLAGNAASELPSISGNGNVVAFTSKATNLTPDLVSGLGDVFRVGTNGSPQMELVSKSDIAENPLANAAMRTTDLDTVGDVIDSSGNLIVFQGAPTNWNFCGLSLNLVEHVFVRKLTTPQRTFLVSQFGGTPGDGLSHRPSISADGSTIAFTSKAFNFDPDGNAIEDVFFSAMPTSCNTALTKIRDFQGFDPNQASFLPMLSTNGQHIVFVSDATDFTDPNGADPDNRADLRDVFLHHRDAQNLTQLLSRDCTDEQENGASYDPDIALGGRAIIYQSLATNLVDSTQDGMVQTDDNGGIQDMFETGLKPHFRRGDADQDTDIDQMDAEFIAAWVTGGPRPNCVDSADINDDGVVDITDAVVLGDFVNNTCGNPPCPPPAPPFPGCGFDPTDDCLTCKQRPPDCTETHAH